MSPLSRTDDPVEAKVIQQLEDPQWDFRTIEGIARATGLAEDNVEAALEQRPDVVREALVRDAQGRRLFTLREKPVSRRERLAFLRSVAAKSGR